MASSLPLSLLLHISCISLLLALLVSPAAQAATCASPQTFKNIKLYSNCTDLPVLSSYLHWTYDRSNSSLSIAFVAAPAKTDGWVAWAINPTAEKMPGSQALLAHQTTNGTPTVTTYNISSYSSIIPGKLSFDVWDVGAEFSSGTYMIFATVKVPKNAESVNQVWQVGPGVDKTTGFPEKHDFATANLRSYGTLNLIANATTTGGGSTTNTTTGAATCASPQTFKNIKLYSNCTDLPVLSSYLHWTYDRSNSSLFIAFVAAPAKTDGWVAWAINPTAEKMPGSQALLAHQTTNGTTIVNTYNISSYNSIIPGKLSFDVWDLSAEFSNGTYKIFATVKVPKNAESVNQVWQVGPGVDKTTGFPEKHDFATANLRSYGTLNLVANATTTGGGSTTNTTTGAATCASPQTFKNIKLYSNCTDLPVLSSYLHWTYDRSNSSLSIAFVAAPAKTDGWVAWAINPTAEKMPGSQALLAHQTTSGTTTVNTYNISSYNSIIPGKLSFDVWDLSAEFSNGTYKIFATVKVPKNAESVNQVWQVGPGVDKTTGFPEKHDFAIANLRSYGTLNLVANATTTGGGSTTDTTTGGGSTTNTTGGGSGALRTGNGGNMGLFSVSLLVLGALIAF